MRVSEGLSTPTLSTERVRLGRGRRRGSIELIVGRAMDWQRNGVGETRTL